MKATPRTIARTTALLGVAAAALVAAPVAGAATAGVGSAPRPATGSARVGALPAATPLSLEVFLRPRDPAALERFATGVSTPGSPDYGHYLAPGQFGPRFGATPETVAAVTRALRAAGLSPGPVSANDLSIPVAADAATVGRALQTGFAVYRLPGGRRAFANTAAPRLPASVIGSVQAIVGLDDLAVRRPRLASAASPASVPAPHTSPPAACSAAKGVGGGSLTIDQLATAYNATPLYSAGPGGYFGQGTSVAIYELEGNFASDIPVYESCFGASAPVSYVHVDGGAGAADPSNFDGLETELDIENVVGLAPQTRVTVYQGPNTGAGALDVYQHMIDDDTAQVLSTSWGLCEAQEAVPDTSALAAENTLFQQAASQGQSIFAASGDNGSEDCTDLNGDTLPGKAVDDPASQPFVTGAGGTTLAVNNAKHRTSETVWNDGVVSGNGAGGGGISNFWAMPDWQYDAITGQQLGTPPAADSTSCPSPLNTVTHEDRCREVPDVSANADPNTGYVVYWDGGWTSVGGTSGAAPLWAGLTALTDSCAQSQSLQPVGLLNPKIYGLANPSTTYHSAFTDITSGNNDYLDPTLHATGYVAGTGYDMASGLGAPIAGSSGLDDQLCAGASADLAPAITSLSPTAGSTAGGTSITIRGQDFTPGATVSFGGTPPTSAQVLSFNAISVVAPAGSGSVPVTVSTPSGTSNAATYTYQTPAPPPSPPPTTPTSTSQSPPPVPLAPVSPATTPTPPVTAPPQTTGRLVVSLRQSGTSILLGRAACPGACTVSVTGFVTVNVKSHGRRRAKQLRVAVLSMKVPVGAARSLKLTLNSAGRALLRQRRRLTVTLVFRVLDQSARASTLTRRVSLRSLP